MRLTDKQYERFLEDRKLDEKYKMAFKEYNYGTHKKEIKNLLRKRLALKDRVRFHQKRVEYHKEKTKSIKDKIIPELEKEINSYLKRAGN